MDKERIIDRKIMETTQKLRKGLILYLILFSYYLLELILWKDMAKSNGQGTHHRQKRMETTQENRIGLMLYLNIFSYYLLMLILWKDMAKSNGQGTHHRQKNNGNNTKTS